MNDNVTELPTPKPAIAVTLLFHGPSGVAVGTDEMREYLDDLVGTLNHAMIGYEDINQWLIANASEVWEAKSDEHGEFGSLDPNLSFDEHVAASPKAFGRFPMFGVDVSFGELEKA